MRRWIVVVALAVVGALGVTVAMPPSAAQAAVAVPDPVNILPSTVKGAVMSGTGAIGKGQVTLALMLRAAAVQLSERKALAALEAGVATPAEVTTVNKIKGKFKMPAMKIGGAIKTAGAVGIALMADQFFVGIGHGISEAFGVDVEGNVCGTGSPIVAVLSQVDCTQYQMTEDAIAQANADAAAGWVVPGACFGTACFTQKAEVVTQGFATSCVLGDSGLSGSSPVAYLVGKIGGQWSRGDVRGWGANSHYSPARAACQAVLGAVSSTTFNAELYFWTGGVGGYAALREVPEYGLCATAMTLATCTGSETFEPVTPVYSDGDPERVLRCELTSTTGAKLSADSAAFHESEGAIPPVVCPEFPPEFIVDHMSIWEVGGPQPLELYSESVTPEYSAARSAYPECLGGTCLLDLRATASGASCFAAPEECADWFADPNKGSKFSCHYGQHAVDLAECTIYAPTFKEDATATGNVYGDPVTGEALPGSGVGSALEPGIADPEQPRECFPTGWGVFNPVEWVMKPTQCALQWAFVPRLSVVQQVFADSSAAWDDTMPRQLISTVQSWVFVPVPPSGCDGITVDVWFLGPPFQIMQACPGDPLESMALWSRIFGNLLFGVYGALAIIRHVARIIGFEGLGEGKTLE